MMPIAAFQVKWGSIANHAPDLPLESMLASIPFFLRVPFVVLAIIASTVAHTTPLFLVALAAAMWRLFAGEWEAWPFGGRT